MWIVEQVAWFLLVGTATVGLYVLVVLVMVM